MPDCKFRVTLKGVCRQYNFLYFQVKLRLDFFKFIVYYTYKRTVIILNYLPQEPLYPMAFLNLDETFLNRYGISVDTFWTNTCDYSHYHDYFQLYYTVKGEYIHTINGEEKVCRAGDVSLIMPYTVHKTDTRKSDIENTLVVTISLLPKFFTRSRTPFHPLSYKEAVYKDSVIPTSLFLQGSEKTEADRLIGEIYSEYEKRSDMLLTKILKLLCCFFDLCAKASACKPDASELSEALTKAKLIYAETSRMSENCTKKLSTDDAAQRASMSRSTFTRTFRKVTGMTFHDMQRGMRIRLVIELMRYTRKSIAEIADECGFSSNAHFTKECIKNFSHPPHRLRNIMIKRTRENERTMPKRRDRKAWEHFRSSELVREHFNASIGKF